MNEPKRFSAILLGIIAVIVLVLAFDSRAQSHECQGGHNCNDGGAVSVDTALTGGDVLVKTRAFSLSGSDMDINDCLATFSYVFGIIQDVKTNPFCFAMQLDSIGKHREAAEVRCSVRRIKKIFKDDCVESMTAKPVEIVPQTPADDARIKALYALVSDLQAERVQDKAEAEKVAQRPIPQPQTIIQQQEFINESKRAKLAALKAEK